MPAPDEPPSHEPARKESATASGRPVLSSRAGLAGSSAIRDLLSQAAQPGMISLAGGLPDPDRFPIRELAQISEQVLRERGRQILQYGETLGQPQTREVLGQHFGLAGQPLLITTGSQQGLDLLARVLFDAGDLVVTSDPEYLGTLQVLRSYQAVPFGIPVDSAGLDTAFLEAQLVSGLRPKACYIVPHFHNPTGATLSVERRHHLHALSARYAFVVIEDDPYRELYYDPSPPLEIEADENWTVRLRSTSKTLAPGLRIGVTSGPQHLIDAMAVAKQSADLHTSTLTQVIVAEAVQAPWFVDHLRSLRASYGHKRSVLIEALTRTFADSMEMIEPAGGMFVWVDFRSEVDTAVWLSEALKLGVCFVPGEAFAVDLDLHSFMRLSFTTASDEGLLEGVSRLHRSYAAMTGE